METTQQFSPGQILYFRHDNNEFIKCEYMQHFRKEIHVVKAMEGEYQGTYWKDADELLTEKPNED